MKSMQKKGRERRVRARENAKRKKKKHIQPAQRHMNRVEPHLKQFVERRGEKTLLFQVDLCIVRKHLYREQQ